MNSMRTQKGKEGREKGEEKRRFKRSYERKERREEITGGEKLDWRLEVTQWPRKGFEISVEGIEQVSEKTKKTGDYIHRGILDRFRKGRSQWKIEIMSENKNPKLLVKISVHDPFDFLNEKGTR